MKTKFASIMASVVAGALLLTSAMPASAQSLLGRDSPSYSQPIPVPNNPQWNGNRPNYSQRDRVITSYCDRNPRDRDCRGYYGGGWGDREYNNFYSSRRSSLDSIASGLFGFGFGAIIGGALANGANNNNNNYGGGRPVYNGGSSYQAHVNACYNRYRSYDEQTNTFMGYDGVRRQCQL